MSGAESVGAGGQGEVDPGAFPFDSLRFDEHGLAPAIVQDGDSKEVLMLGFMNREALETTVAEQKVCFWSRSRKQLWRKGETSGMVLHVSSIRINCEGNSLLILATAQGPTCHTGHTSCYYREAGDGVWRETAPVVVSPEELYGKKPG